MKKNFKVLFCLIFFIAFTFAFFGCSITEEKRENKIEDSVKNQPTLEKNYQESAKNPPKLIYPAQTSSIETLNVRFNWSICLYADYYEIEIQDKNWEIIVSENTKSDSSRYFVSDKFKDNAIYYWRVRAHYPPNIWGSWSNKNWFSIQTIESKKNRLNQALSKLHKNHDNVENIDWFYDRDVYNISGSKIYLYLGKTDDNIWMRFVIYHTYSSDLWWLFIESYTLNIDGEKYYINPDWSDIKRDNSIYSMWEIYDYKPGEEDIIMIEKIIKSKKTILRCVGEDKYKDREITYKEKKGLDNILNAYRLKVGS